MHSQFLSSEPEVSEEGKKARKLFRDLVTMRGQIIAWAEKGELTKEKLAKLFAGFPIADEILASYNPEPGTFSETGNMIVNEAIEYSGGRPEEDWIGIGILATPVKGTTELMNKIVDGLKKIAEEMRNGWLQQVEKVNMVSWLLGPAFEEKIKAILGKDILLQDPEASDSNVAAVQHMALSYNKRAIEDYLKTGQLPVVKKLVMSREEFLKKFG